MSATQAIIMLFATKSFASFSWESYFVKAIENFLLFLQSLM